MHPCFNTSGPCIPGEHYMLPPERRLGAVLALIEGRRFFTLDAAHRTGKTTTEARAAVLATPRTARLDRGKRVHVVGGVGGRLPQAAGRQRRPRPCAFCA